MNQFLNNAKEELKRVDHLVYVSLKYTRTVDVIRNIIQRIISSFDFAIQSLLEYAKENKLIDSYPSSPGLRCELLKKIYNNEELNIYLDFYTLLRGINRADFSKREEYRRHVTMIVTLQNGNIIEIKIDTLHEYFNKLKEFLKLVGSIIKND